MTTDLVTFLRQTLDRDERDASEDHTFGCKVRDYYDDEDEPGPVVDPEACDCPVRRRLLEVEAKRRILDRFEEAVKWYSENRSAPAGEVHGLRTAVDLLALPYADRPGFREEWRP